MKKKITFLLVGGFTFIIYYSLLFLFYGLFELYYLIAMAIAYSIAVIFHFFCNRTFTFKKVEGNLGDQIGKYVLLSIASYLMQTILTVSLYELMGISFYLSFSIAVIVCTVITYLIMNHWVFGKVKHDYC